MELLQTEYSFRFYYKSINYKAFTADRLKLYNSRTESQNSLLILISSTDYLKWYSRELTYNQVRNSLLQVSFDDFSVLALDEVVSGQSFHICQNIVQCRVVYNFKINFNILPMCKFLVLHMQPTVFILLNSYKIDPMWFDFSLKAIK